MKAMPQNIITLNTYNWHHDEHLKWKIYGYEWLWIGSMGKINEQTKRIHKFDRISLYSWISWISEHFFFLSISFHINIFLLKSLQSFTQAKRMRDIEKQKMAWIYGEMTMNSVYTHSSTTAIYTNPRDRYFSQFILEFGFIYVHRCTDSICEKFQPYFDVVAAVVVIIIVHFESKSKETSSRLKRRKMATDRLKFLRYAHRIYV